jgi:hypothetical protein
MLTQDSIEQVRRQTNVSTMDAIHALTISGGDVGRAIDELNDHCQHGNRAIVAQTRGEAQRLAGALVDSGIWFECEATANGTRRFSVALGAYARLRSLYENVRAEPETKLAVAA